MDGTPLVLVVGDAGHDSVTVVRSLKADRDLRVKGPIGVLDALRYAERHPLAAALVHVELPDISGPEFCRLIRTRRTTARVPLVLFSSRGSSHAPEHLAHADAYLSQSELDSAAAKVKALVFQQPDSHNSESDWVQTFSGRHLSANFRRVAIAVDGHRVDLARRELRLLQFLVTHKNHVLTRHDLLTHVWNGENDGHSRTIDAHIFRLRKKLGHAGEQIHTLPGIGYRFLEE